MRGKSIGLMTCLLYELSDAREERTDPTNKSDQFYGTVRLLQRDTDMKQRRDKEKQFTDIGKCHSRPAPAEDWNDCLAPMLAAIGELERTAA